MSVLIGDFAKKCGQPEAAVRQILGEAAKLSGAERVGLLRSAGLPVARMHNLGVLFVDESYSGLTHPFFAAMLNAFKQEAEARGYDITFINHNISGTGRTYLEHCRERNVDGVCLACVDFYAKEVEELMSSDIPCVTVDHPWPNQPCVISDNHSGLRMLVDYAVSMGHRRIAFIHGQDNSEVTRIRIEEYLAAMKAHGLSVPEGYLVEGRYDEMALVGELLAKLLERSDRPSCILLPDDVSYLRAQEVIREHELRIPADISVAGYDGIRLTQSLRPQLTTVHQDAEIMGREAAIRLVERIERPESVDLTPYVVPVKLIKGSTMGWCNQW